MNLIKQGHCLTLILHLPTAYGKAKPSLAPALPFPSSLLCSDREKCLSVPPSPSLSCASPRILSNPWICRPLPYNEDTHTYVQWDEPCAKGIAGPRSVNKLSTLWSFAHGWREWEAASGSPRSLTGGLDWQHRRAMTPSSKIIIVLTPSSKSYPGTSGDTSTQWPQGLRITSVQSG